MEHDPLTKPNAPSDAEIEEAASQFVEMLRWPFEQIRQTTGWLEPKKTFDLLMRAIEDPEGLKRDLIAESHKIDPSQTREGIEFMSFFVRSPRKAVEPMLKDVLPPGTPGKRPQITRENEKQMVRMAQSLWPVVSALIKLREGSSKRTVKESVDYLAADHPLGAQTLLKHIDLVNSLLMVPEQPKGQKTRTRRLIYLVIAQEFKISPSYAERWLGPSLTSMKPID
jgi:hypothetical protein